MRIGIDIDDVLIDLNSPLIDFHNKEYGTNIKRSDFETFNLWETWGGTREEAIKKIEKFSESDHFKLIKPTEEVISLIDFFSKKNELFVITSRHNKSIDFTRNWIEKFFPNKFKKIFFTNHFGDGETTSKDEICIENKIDLFIEDNMDWAKVVAEKGIHVLLFDAPWNQNFKHKNMERVFNWEEVAGIIKGLEVKVENKKFNGVDSGNLGKIGIGKSGFGANNIGNLNNYFKSLEEKVLKEYDIANLARSKGFDPVNRVETPLAINMAEKCVNLVATIYPDLPVKKIAGRILELENKYGKLNTTVPFEIAKEVAENKFFKFDRQLDGIDCGIRIGFSYLTLGVVASPIEGYTGIEIGKTKNDKEYFIAKFSGPIRSAGTTSACLVLMLIDYLREYFGYSKYDPTNEEIQRYIVENRDYHERITNLQYFPTEEEMEFLAKNLPIQISGDPTEKLEVSNYKDLKRVETNFIRGGMCLIFSEGLAQKAAKGANRLSDAKKNGVACTGWDFLEEYLEIHKKREQGNKEVTATYINDLVAGRPVYSHPSRGGGFRLRYGKGRNSGFSAVSIHPATMGVSGGFLSNGTQLKLEKPTKGCIITACDSIDGPIVKLKNGTVKKVKSFDEGKRLYNDIEEIIYLGDILFPLGDVIDRGVDLLRPGYVEEWWGLKLKEKDPSIDLDSKIISFEESVTLSKKHDIPLYPKFIFYWSQITNEDFLWLLDWLQNGIFERSKDAGGKIILPWGETVSDKFKEGKRALEILGVSHSVIFDKVIIDEDSPGFLFNLGIESDEAIKLKEKISDIINLEKGRGNVLEIINSLCSIEVKDKAGSFIGARMGRPEKAKLRKLTGSPNGLFPVSNQGGRLNSIQEACNTGFIRYNWPTYECECGNKTIYFLCEKCGQKTKKKYYCTECGKSKDSICNQHKNQNRYHSYKIEIKNYFSSAVDILGYKDHEIPTMIKGIKKLTNKGDSFEHLSKAILRADFNLSVNKDGTIRYDGTEVPLTHFKPKEIGVNIPKLKELGYCMDIKGNNLEDEDQIIELLPHDIILPSCSVTMDEKADDVFLNISKFIDKELEKLYGLEKYYNIKDKKDLIGQLIVCMAPHNCAGVVGRIIGFTEIQGIVASPYIHAAVRRDCDGDEIAVMMLMDVLINFSREFLPGHRGGTQDAPLVLNARIEAGEVDDQILNFETCFSYPLEVYELAEQEVSSGECNIETVKTRLNEKINPFLDIGFTHDTDDFNSGFVNGSYKVLPTMKDKVEKQMELVEKIRAADTVDVVRLMIERHFIRDIRGNLRKFAKQRFRCSSCNRKYRRPPMKGECFCGGKIIFTISEGSIRKYLGMAIELSEKYKIPEYTKEGIMLANEYVNSIFGEIEEKQEKLDGF
jgi:DNA polymerase II large subunit